ncbi:hypothetical protein ATO13_08611 [Stappia sp. 22II-S9-Z10]|nr:hypothetical protein ATO13_08611 [Stappia sp. 22II-S9-Z10]
MTARNPMAQRNAQADMLTSFMLPKAYRDAAAMRQVKALSDEHGWVIAWHAAVEAVFCGTAPEFTLATFEGWCKRLAAADAA